MTERMTQYNRSVRDGYEIELSDAVYKGMSPTVVGYPWKPIKAKPGIPFARVTPRRHEKRALEKFMRYGIAASHYYGNDDSSEHIKGDELRDKALHIWDNHRDPAMRAAMKEGAKQFLWPLGFLREI